MPRLGVLAKSRPVAIAVIAIAVFAGVVLARESGQLEGLELSAYDWFVRQRPVTPLQDERISLVTITEDDIQTLGRYPVPHGMLGDALARIMASGPRGVGIDIYLDVPVPPGRERLDAVLEAHPNIIAVTKFTSGDETGVRPPTALKNTDQVGFNDLLVDPGGIVRRGLLFVDDGSRIFTSFALRLAMQYLSVAGAMPHPDPNQPQHLRFGSTTFVPLTSNIGSYVNADAAGYQFFIDYADPIDSFPRLSLSQVLSGDFDDALLRDRVVLLGVTAESVKDLFYTPLSREYGGVRQTSGVEIHARIVSQLLRSALDGSATLKTLSEAQELALIALCSLVGAILSLLTARPVLWCIAALGSAAVLTLGVFACFLQQWWVPLVPTIIAWALSAGLATAYISMRDKQDQASLMNLFSRHISPQLASSIWSQRDQFISGSRPKPQKLTGTVFFSDIAGFTTVSESLDPTKLTDWISGYMSAMTPVVNSHRGVILRFMGDAIMAVFGIPVPRTSEDEVRQDAVNAVACALEMQEQLKIYNANIHERGLPMVGMRIGIYTGHMVSATFGDIQRMEYNVHGDTVNTAARLETFDKESFKPDYLEQPCRILIGHTTAAYLADAFELEKVGDERLKGKEQSVAIYHVLGRKR